MKEFTPPISAWFAGPKAENGDDFVIILNKIIQDYYYWRRNYFPEDGVIITSEMRRKHDEWNDAFYDKLTELLADLKADFPFQSPRYIAHMLSEQTLPSIAGYFSAMLYNPNNVTRESAPVTVKLEIEAGKMLAKMLGYNPDTSWSHLCSGGTLANIEALWVARSVKYLPFVLRDLITKLNLTHSITTCTDQHLLSLNPQSILSLFNEVYHLITIDQSNPLTLKDFIDCFRESEFNVSQNGISKIVEQIQGEPVILVPETYHYCLPKALDLLGLGRNAMIKIPVDEFFRMNVSALNEIIDEQEKKNKHIIAVVAVAGTTEEGAIDPIEKISALRTEREHQGKSSFWFHADAAYGAYLRTLTIPTRIGLGEKQIIVFIKNNKTTISLNLPEIETCDSLEKLHECDSIAIDPHKLGYVPYPAGAICFKSNLVKPLMRQDAPYLEESPADIRSESSSQGIGVYVLEGSKPGASAASVWLSHSVIPLDNNGHGRLMRETIRSACELHTLLESWNELTDPTSVQAVCLCPPQSNIVCYLFRAKNKQQTLKEINHYTQQLYDQFSIKEELRQKVYDQKFFISRTVLTAQQYSYETVSSFLQKINITKQDYEENGVVLLRSTLMNPWYSHAKSQGRYYLVEFVEELYQHAEKIILKQIDKSLIP